jgi:hypothetical protein
MTGHLHLVFLGYGNDALEPVINALPHLVGIGRSVLEFAEASFFRLARAPLVQQFIIIEARETGAASSQRACGSQMTEDGDIVVKTSQTRLTGHANDLADQIQLAFAFIARF